MLAAFVPVADAVAAGDGADRRRLVATLMIIFDIPTGPSFGTAPVAFF